MRTGKSFGMQALTVQPSTPDSLQVTDVPDPEPGAGDLLVDGLAIGVCGTDREIAAANTAGRRRAATGSSSGTSRWAGCAARRRTAVSMPATWWSAWCAARIRCRAAPARTASSTCAATAATPSAASRRSTATPANAGASKPTTRSRLDPTPRRRRHAAWSPRRVVAKAWEQVSRIGERAYFEPHTRPGHRRGTDRPAGRACSACSRDSDLTSWTGSPTGRSRARRDLGATYHHDDIDVSPRAAARRRYRGHRRRPVVFGAIAQHRRPTASCA